MLQCSLINIVRCALSAPNGSSPRGYSRITLCFEFRLKYSVLHHHTSTRHSLSIISSGARSALPMVVAPEAIVEFFSGIVSSTDYSIVGANLVSSLMSSFIRKSLYSIFVEYMYLSNLIFNSLSPSWRQWPIVAIRHSDWAWTVSWVAR
jgi:hypothetical protein